MRVWVHRWAATAAAGLAAAAALALEPADQLQLADGLYARGLHELSIKEYLVYLAAVTNSPKADVVHYRVGESYSALGNAVAAERAYLRVFNEFPASPFRWRAGLRRAELKALGKDPATAIPLLEALTGTDVPEDVRVPALYALGNSYEKAGRDKEAIETYSRVVTDYPGNTLRSYAALALGNVSAGHAGMENLALDLYRMAVTNPATPRVGAEAWFQLGELQFRRKDFAAAAQAYESLRTQYPQDERAGTARLPLAWSYQNVGRYADALRLAAEAMAAAGNAAAPQEADWLYLKANSERQLLKHADAAETYTRLLQKYPAGPLAESAAYERALTRFKLGDYAKAVEEGRALVAMPKVQRDAYWLLAESYAALQQEAEAIQFYRLLVDQHPDAPLAADALYRLGFVLQRKGEHLQAAELFERLVERQPAHELAAQALLAAAFSLSKAGKTAEAVRDWAAVVQQYPQSPLVEEALYQKALGETTLRRDAPAVASWRDLLARFPKTTHAAEGRFWVGVLLEEGGKPEDAEAEFRAALQAGPDPELQARVQFRLALVLQRRGKVEESAALLQGLLNSPVRDRFTPELLEWLAEYHLSRKEYAPALENAGLLASRSAEDAWQQIAAHLQGVALRGQGQAAPARAAFEKAVAFPPRGRAAADSYLNLAELALGEGDAAKAREAFDRAAVTAATDELLPIRARAYAGTARALRTQGDLDGAAKHFLSVAILFDSPDLVPECLFEAAAVLKQAGRAADSDKVRQELKTRYPDSAWAGRELP
jgi:TolA-binding protein